MTEPYNPFAVPESGAERSSGTMRPLSFAELIAVVIATILLTGMMIGVLFVFFIGGLMAVDQLSRLDLDLLLIGGVAITLMAIVLVVIGFARRASVAISQPVTKQVSDEGAD